MKYVSYICLLISAIIGAIWVIQWITELKILDNPLVGVSIFINAAFLLNWIDRRNSADKNL